VAWQRDFGDDTAMLAPEIDTFNPDAEWTQIVSED
jgi:hypothetical protein